MPFGFASYRCHRSGVTRIARTSDIASNPEILRVKDSSKRLKQPRNLTPEEFQTTAKAIAEPFRTMVLIAGGLGLRVSEIVGLQWQDFDFEAGTLLIQRSIVHGRVGETKTLYSKDCVPLDASLIDVVRKHRLPKLPMNGCLRIPPLVGHTIRRKFKSAT